MKIRLMVATSIVALSFGLSSAQSAADLNAKYGIPEKAYAVSDRVWMSPDYAADGQVCRMRLYARHIAADTDFVSQQLSFGEFYEVVEELVPRASRGAPKELASASRRGWATGGGSMWSIFAYEWVTLTFVNGSKVDLDASSIQRGEYTLGNFAESSAEPEAKPAAEPKNEFEPYKDSPVEVVTIAWNDRKCVGE
ncbi:MAG: hypothetical protein ABIP75_11840 [Pyrinomonadaceae bacterium]